MKKKIIFIFILLIIGILNVNAKDTVYSINNYKDSSFNYIEKAYDNDLKEDGYVLLGTYLKETIEKDEEDYNNYQVILVKYNKYDKISWKYTYGNSKDDDIYYLSYSYDDSNIDGYLMVVNKTYDILTESGNDNTSVIIKIDLEGKLVYEKEINEGIIKKIIPTYEEDKVNGYIAIIDNKIIKYNKNLDIEWQKELDKNIDDISIIKEDNKQIGYVIIKEDKLFKLDLEGNNLEEVENLEKYLTYHLESVNNGFILYGLTDEVKLKDGDYSYYLINYKNDEKNETIGTIPINREYDIKLLYVNNEYFILYKNDADKSYEIIKIDNEEKVNKVKKINNSYYDFLNYTTDGKTIYLIGQINCPDDEKCEYDNRSLYLVSDEDKVIEVKEKESTGIIIVVGVFVLLISSVFIIRRKKRLNKK